MLLKAGTTSVSTYFILRDTTTNQPKTGVTITGIGVGYTRAGAALAGTATLTALANAASAWAANYGFEVDATNAPGLYRIDWPDAAFAAGVRMVMLSVHAANVIPEQLRVELNAAVDAVAVSGDTSTADNLELMAKTGGAGAKLTLTQLNVVAGSNDTAVVITGSGTGNGMSITSGSGATGTGLVIASAATNGSGMTIVGKGTGDGLQVGSGNTLPTAAGHAVNVAAGVPTRAGLFVKSKGAAPAVWMLGDGTYGATGLLINAGETYSPSLLVGNYQTGGAFAAGKCLFIGHMSATIGMSILGAGSDAALSLIGGSDSGTGLEIIAGATGKGMTIAGGATSGDALSISATSGNAILATAGTSGAGMKLVGVGAGKYDLDVTTKGVGGNITGNLSGSAGSLTGYVAPANGDITAIKAKTDNLPATPASQADVTGVSAALLAAALSQSPQPGSVGEALVAALANAKNKLAITGTTMTLYKADGTTPLYAWTLNSPTEPTSRVPA